MEFRILGGVSLHVAGTPVDLGVAKNRTLLGLLLLLGTRPVDPETLFAPLWNEEDQPLDPRGTLHSYVARLRGRLKDAGCNNLLPKDVRTPTYRVDVDFDLVDYHRFKRLATQARAAIAEGSYEAAIRDLTDATRLWQGALIADLKTDWARRRQETEKMCTLLPAYYDLCKAHLNVGNTEAVLQLLDDELAEYHPNESLARYRVHALAAADRVDEIPAYHKEFRRQHVQNMGVEPTDELATVVHQLTRRTATLASARNQPEDSTPSLACALPRDLSDFADRDDLKTELDRLLLAQAGKGTAPVVTLEGPPGVGKTSLAIHWANERRRSFTDGVLFSNLGGYGHARPLTAADVLADLLTALGAASAEAPDAPVDLMATLYQKLTDKRFLVILDNAYDSEHVRSILAALAPCPVLITSRQRLTGLSRHEGARPVPVDPLPERDAVSLISERLPTAESHTVRDIASLCGGIAMGITIVTEYLAAHRALSADELVLQLRQDKRRLLDAGDHGDNTETLRRIFAPSYQALPDEAQRLFRLLGLHPTARFSTSVAAAVAAAEEDETERFLDMLCGANLLRKERLGVYRLHDLLHVYAGQCAAGDETADARSNSIERQLDWYLQRAHEAHRLIAPHQPPVPSLPVPSTTADRSFADSSAAIAWCVHEQPTLIAAVRTAADHGLHHHCWRLVAETRELFWRYGDQQDNLEIHRLAIAAAHAANDSDGESGTLSNLGTMYLQLHQIDKAQKCYENALAISQRIDSPTRQVELLHNLGAVEVKRGNFRAGIDLYHQSLALIEHYEDDLSPADTHNKIGEAYRLQERHREAQEHYHLALSMSQQNDNLRLQGIILGQFGALHLEIGAPEKAILYAEQGLAIHHQTLDEIISAKTLATLAEAHHRLRHYQAALDAASESVAIHRAVGTLAGHPHMLDLLAELHSATGDDDAARGCWEQALTLLPEPRASEIRNQLDALQRFTNTSSVTTTREHASSDPRHAAAPAAEPENTDQSGAASD